MLILAGIVPQDLGFVHGFVELAEKSIRIGDISVPVEMGTGALVGAAAVVCDVLDMPAPYVILASEDDSKNIYDFLKKELWLLDCGEVDVLTLHYMVPDRFELVDVLMAMEELGKHPVMIADAGGMYAAKISGMSNVFDLFTPDIGEMAYLADESASHPLFVHDYFYIQQAGDVDMLVQKASQASTLAKNLLIKGEVDYIVSGNRIVASVDTPSIPAMEAIGGTGDMLTGIVSALIYAGFDVVDAAVTAAKVNRVAGAILGAELTAATPVAELLEVIRCALSKELGQRRKIQ